MNGVTEKETAIAAPKLEASRERSQSFCFRIFAVVSVGLLAGFAKPIYDAVQLSRDEELHSHILLIPLITAYLIWIRRTELPRPRFGSPLTALGGILVAGIILALSFVVGGVGQVEVLSLRPLALLVLIGAGVATILGGAFFKAVAFPWAFLIFAVPLPPTLAAPIEIASIHASAEVYSWMMDLSQNTYYREGLRFAMPGLNILVAQECSGIRSSYVLFIVSLLAGNLFLTSPWRRLALALFVFPLGIARNAFRIFVLSVLSVHWDRSVIDGPLHHRGGPIFFALSLIPFCIVLFWLSKSELKRRQKPQT